MFESLETEITVLNVVLLLFMIGLVVYMYYFFAKIRKQLDEVSVAIQNRKKRS